MKNILYIASLILIVVSIIFILQFPDSGRMNAIAGFLTIIGFSANVSAFLMPKKVQASRNN